MSPGLEASIDAWLADPTSESGQKTEKSLARAVSRMAARPTPFGLFASSTVGAFAEIPISSWPRAQHRRYTRFDGDYLSDLTDALVADKAVRPRLLVRPNSSLCHVAGRLRCGPISAGPCHWRVPLPASSIRTLRPGSRQSQRD